MFDCTEELPAVIRKLSKFDQFYQAWVFRHQRRLFSTRSGIQVDDTQRAQYTSKIKRKKNVCIRKGCWILIRRIRSRERPWLTDAVVRDFDVSRPSLFTAHTKAQEVPTPWPWVLLDDGGVEVTALESEGGMGAFRGGKTKSTFLAIILEERSVFKIPCLMFDVFWCDHDWTLNLYLDIHHSGNK